MNPRRALRQLLPKIKHPILSSNQRAQIVDIMTDLRDNGYQVELQQELRQQVAQESKK